MGLLGVAGTACASVLGIEETTLGEEDAGVAFNCEEPIIPYVWYFADELSADSTFALFVLRNDVFNGIAGQLSTSVDPGKGHLSVDVRNCITDPQLGFLQAKDVKLELQQPQANATEFYISDGIPTQTDRTKDGIGGFLNLNPGNIVVRTVPTAINLPAAERALAIRSGFLTTLRLEPNSNVDQVPPSPPAAWACVGSVPEPPNASTSTIKLTALIFDFTQLPNTVPVAGVSLKACGRNDPLCDIRGNEAAGVVAKSDATGTAVLTLDASSGSFDGYVVVRGNVRKAEDSRCVPAGTDGGSDATSD